MKPSPRRLILLAVALVILSIGAWRSYRHVRPCGAKWYPPILGLSYGSVDGGRFTAPDGRVVQVIFHDFGAAHSGNYWTWIVVDRLFTGKQVVVEGYSGADVRDGGVAFPLRWNADGSLTVEFLLDRFGTSMVSKTVRF